LTLGRRKPANKDLRDGQFGIDPEALPAKAPAGLFILTAFATSSIFQLTGSQKQEHMQNT
jgi:hypothetical protein